MFSDTIPYFLFQESSVSPSQNNPLVISELARLIASETLLGQVLRTLIHYVRESPAERRDEDLVVLLLVSTAVARSYEESRP